MVDWLTGYRLLITGSLVHWLPITGPADAEDAAAKLPTLHSYGDGAAIVKKPVAVYIEKVYESGDFSGLGIGV